MASHHPYFFFREELLRLFSVTPPFLASGERAQKVHMKMNMNKISAMYNDDNSKNLPAMSSQPLSFAYPSLLRKDVQHVTQHAPSAFPGSKENQPGLGAYFDNNIAAMLAAAGTVSAPPIAHMPDFSANPLAALLLQEAALQNRMHQTPIPPSIHFKQAMNAQADKPMYNQLSLTKAKTSSDYVDFAKLYSTESLKKDKNFNRSKKSSFPMKLYSILKDNEFSDCISWMPHGRSWKVLDQAKFEQKVIPLFFRHAKMASFMRQVNGWGFRRMADGLDRNAYYHQMFLRGYPDLCEKMQRPTDSVRNKYSEPKPHLNFYDTNQFVPTPSVETS